MSQIVQKLAQIVGMSRVITAPEDLAVFLNEPRRLFHGKAMCVVQPNSTQQVAAVVALCQEYSIGLVPQGGNTGLVGGQSPDASGTQIILSTQRLNQLRAIDCDAKVLIAEAGVTLSRAQSAAREKHLLLPLSLASEGSATLGGLVATNAGGTAALAYGTMKDQLLGIEVVLADGRILNLLSKLKKDNTGYNLVPLFAGSEGTLAVITAVSLKLASLPVACCSAWLGLASSRKALQLLTHMQAHFGLMLKSFELIPRIGLDFVIKHHSNSRDPLPGTYPWYVLAMIDDTRAADLVSAFEDYLVAAKAAELIEDATLARTNAQSAAFWALRENLSEAQQAEGGSIKQDVSLPIASVPEFLRTVEVLVSKAIPGARLVAFGHLGDGNIHCNVSQPIGADRHQFLARWQEVNALVYDLVLEFGGSISAEHGIGQLKRHLLRRTKDPLALELMEKIKLVFDPNGILNPGKIL